MPNYYQGTHKGKRDTRMKYLILSVNAGDFLLLWNNDGLLAQIEWLHPQFDREVFLSKKNWTMLDKNYLLSPWPVFIEKLTGYFDHGEPIGEIPWSSLSQEAWTPFQKEVYQRIEKIPHGETRTYGWVAEGIGKVFASRAVGQALRKNPIPLIIPCHRVVSSTGDMGGFMGSKDPERPELKLKKLLIDLEQTYRNPVFPFLTTDFPTLEIQESLSAS